MTGTIYIKRRRLSNVNWEYFTTIYKKEYKSPLSRKVLMIVLAERWHVDNRRIVLSVIPNT